MTTKMYTECGNIIFEHYVGSALINNRSENSDYDIFRVHKTLGSTSIEATLLIGAQLGNISYNSLEKFKKEYFSHNIIDLICVATVKDYTNVAGLTRYLSHLYAMKYGLVSDIKDQEIFNFYSNWLRAPGIGNVFWESYKGTLWMYFTSMPDKKFNWYDNFDGTSRHLEAKKNWAALKCPSPNIDPELGYDPVLAKYLFQTLYIAGCVLTPNRKVSEDEKLILRRVRDREVSYEEYLELKKSAWLIFRDAYWESGACYFLGTGDTLEESKEKNTFGIRGIKNLLKITTDLE
jgi:hypothetical protein